MSDSTKNFNGRAEDYTAGRPTYAKEFIEYLYAECGMTEASVIVDIGSGTGKFAKQLLEKGSKVFCVEPNDDMRNTAIKELQNFTGFTAVPGTASATTLPDESADFVTTAQAFHWFDVEEFQKECKRILKSNGTAILIWNMRDMDAELNRESHAIYKTFCPRFKGFGGGIEKDDERIRKFFSDKYERLVFENPLFYDKETFIKRSLSGSYSLKKGDGQYEEYITALEELFDKQAVDGILTMPNQTVAYIGKLEK